ncbi:MAG: hypothetical protein JRN14_02595 [Nitrososphaerota archaeon]|nr:hypothetical protein [Nitrososphaerota archaeon]
MSEYRKEVTAGVTVAIIGALALAAFAGYLAPLSGTSYVGTPTTTVTGPGESASTETSLNTQITFSIDPSLCNGNCTINPPWQIYQTLADLTAASQLIVEANVTGAKIVGVRGVPVTYYNLTILTSIKSNSNISAGTILSMSQIGGTYNGTTMNLEGYPSLTVGSEYVFFLGDPGSFLAQYYSAFGTPLISVGGPQGTFVVRGGNVFSLDNVYTQADAWLPVKASGTPLSQFASEVETS